MKIPTISQKEINHYVGLASQSPRKRYAEVIHKKGAYFNEALNFLCKDTYMMPHLHDDDDREELIYVIQGELTIFYFDDQGEIIRKYYLDAKGNRYLKVSPFTWHTYAINSPYAVTYETMNGIYDKKTWKIFPRWAPEEKSINSAEYLEKLKSQVQI